MNSYLLERTDPLEPAQTVLLADPDHAVTQTISLPLSIGGYNLVTSNTLAECSIAVDQHEFSAAVIAFSFGAETSIDLIHHLVRKHPDIQIILLTADEPLLDLMDAYDRDNVYNHIRKPIEDIGDLARMLGRALERNTMRAKQSSLLIQLRDAREELNELRSTVAEIERLSALGLMAADISEQLLLPLKSIKGYAAYFAELLAGGSSLDLSSQSVLTNLPSQIHHAALEAISSVQAIQDLAQSGSEDRREFDLHPVIERTVHLLRHRMESAGIELHCEFTDGLDPIYGSAAQVYHAVTHLVLNALDAMPHGGQLTLRTSAGTPGKAARLQIIDTGYGISPELFGTAFSKRSTPEIRGSKTGLGLVVVRSILSDHDAELSLESARGAGSIVTVQFPAHQRLYSTSPQP